MLIIEREVNESIQIGSNIEIAVLKTGNRVKLGVRAPLHLKISRTQFKKDTLKVGRRIGIDAIDYKERGAPESDLNKFLKLNNKLEI